VLDLPEMCLRCRHLLDSPQRNHSVKRRKTYDL